MLVCSPGVWSLPKHSLLSVDSGSQSPGSSWYSLPSGRCLVLLPVYMWYLGNHNCQSDHLSSTQKGWSTHVNEGEYTHCRRQTWFPAHLATFVDFYTCSVSVIWCTLITSGALHAPDNIHVFMQKVWCKLLALFYLCITIIFIVLFWFWNPLFWCKYWHVYHCTSYTSLLVK